MSENSSNKIQVFEKRVLDVLQNRFMTLSKGSLDHEREMFFYLKIVKETPSLKECTMISHQSAFLQAAANGLSFDPSLNEIYLTVSGKEVSFRISPFGQLKLLKRVGKIVDTEIETVHEGDTVIKRRIDGRLNIDHEYGDGERKIETLIAGYAVIIYHSGDIKTVYFERSEMDAWKEKSPFKVKNAWNSLGMYKTKILKHALKYEEMPSLLNIQ